MRGILTYYTFNTLSLLFVIQDVHKNLLIALYVAAVFEFLREMKINFVRSYMSPFLVVFKLLSVYITVRLLL